MATAFRRKTVHHSLERMPHFSLDGRRIVGAEGAEERGAEGFEGVGTREGYLPTQFG